MPEFEIDTRGVKDGEKITRKYKIHAPDGERAAQWAEIQSKVLKWENVKILSVKPVEEKAAAVAVAKV